MIVRRLVAVAVCALLISCGGDASRSTSRGTLRPFTLEEATLVASAPYEDLRAGGATVNVSARFATGETITMRGVVDFRNDVGLFDIADPGHAAGLVGVGFTASTVLEHWTQTPEWVARDVDPRLATTDLLVELIRLLGSPQRGNPLILYQDEFTGFVRSDQLGGVEVMVAQVEPGIRYWVDLDGRLRRVEFTNEASFDGIIDLSDYGAVEVSLPVARPLEAADSWYRNGA